MRKPKYSILLLLTLLYLAFTLGYFFGKNQLKSEITVSVSKEVMTMPTAASAPIDEHQETIAVTFPISINRATKRELTALPGIGDTIAERIIDYRIKNGRFQAKEDLLNVEGIGKKKLEEIFDYITIGG